MAGKPARRTRTRIESLYKEGLASAQEMEQARAQVDMTTTPRPEFDGRRTVEFRLLRD